MTTTPSPDFSEYVDLTIYDTNAETLLNQIVTYARGVIPEWSPRAGEVEMMLAEVFAVGASDLASYINRVPGGVLEGMVSLFGVERSDGVKATGAVTFTKVASSGSVTVVAGTPVIYTGGTTPRVFLTDSDLVIADGVLSGAVTVSADAVGAGHNSVPGSSTVQVIGSNPSISSAAFDADGPSGGVDFETDDAFFARISNTFATFSSAIVTPSQIRASVLDNFASTAYRCAVYDKERYLDRAVSSTTEHPGYVLVAVADQNSTNSSGNFSDVTVSTSEISAIRTHLEDRVPAGLQIDIMSAEVVSAKVEATVASVPGSDTSVVETAINTALAGYLDPNTWDWTKDKVRKNEIISLIDGVTGVDYVVSVDLTGYQQVSPGSATNFTNNGTTGDIDLANLGTLVGNHGGHIITVS